MLVSRHVDLHWELLKWLAILSLAIILALWLLLIGLLKWRLARPRSESRRHP